MDEDPAEEWLGKEAPSGDYPKEEGFDVLGEECFGEHRHYLLGAHLDFVGVGFLWEDCFWGSYLYQMWL